MKIKSMFLPEMYDGDHDEKTPTMSLHPPSNDVLTKTRPTEYIKALVEMTMMMTSL